MGKRYRSMDLLRMIAILLVVLAHSVLSYGAPKHLAPLQLGGVGVDLFFVLSGWLLGGQLFKEIQNNGRIDIKRFWIRRWMRTLPAYYAILLLSIFQRYLTNDNIVFPWEYFFFVQNYDYPLHFFSISWSLCVEEQFYLIIAPLVSLLALTNKRITTFSFLALLILPYIFRGIGWYGDSVETHVRIDGCVAGVFLAYLYHQYKSIWLKIAHFAPYLAIGSVVIFLCFIVARYNPQFGIQDPDKLLLAVLFGIWVICANANDHWREKLYVPGAHYISTRSYALYLLHPEILALLNRNFLGIPFPLYLALAVGGSLVLSEILFRMIEKPFMDAREKIGFSKRIKCVELTPVAAFSVHAR